MLQKRKRFIIFLLLLLQSAVAVSAGFLAIYLSGRVPPGITVAGINAEGMKGNELKDSLYHKYQPFISNGKVEINLNDKVYAIDYDDIDVDLDLEGLKGQIFGNDIFQFMNTVEQGYFLGTRKNLAVPVNYNEGKLLDRLNEINSIVSKAPVNARIYLKDGRLIKTREINGWQLDPAKALLLFKEKFNKGFSSTYTFADAKDAGFIEVLPEYTTETFKELDGIISHYSTIIDEDSLASVNLAAKAVNQVMLYPKEEDKGKKAGIFSFSRFIEAAGGSLKSENTGYDQVASTLYAAVLLGGMDPDSIEKVHNPAAADYIEPGLEVKATGKAADFRFRNTLAFPVVILAEVRGNVLKISLAGKSDPNLTVNELKVDIDQRFEPSVMYIESNSLKPGQKRLLYSGREGLKVSVYRIVTRMNETEQILIDRCLYRAVESVVQIGPGARGSIPTGIK